MKQIIFFLLGIFILCPGAYAQNSVDDILLEIEKNNSTLSALQKHTEAEKTGNKTGIYLENPEFEFHYLWGNQAVSGNRTDISFKQSFDFPTVYKFQNQISDTRNEQADLEYQKQKRDLLFAARCSCYELVYTNALMVEVSKRLAHAQQIANSTKAKFDVGEANILEFNKTQLNLLNVSKELESLAIHRNTLIAELTSLNGGIPVELEQSLAQAPLIPTDFEIWYLMAEENNPLLAWLKQEIEISKNQQKLNRAYSLPKLQAGYMSEKLLEDRLQGISVGISIPLWENKNTVKYAAAKTEAIQGVMADKKILFYNQVKALHFKAIQLQANAIDYRENLLQYDNTELLKKALDKGEITLVDYILELSIYYESVNRLLLQELELNKTMAELNKYM